MGFPQFSSFSRIAMKGFMKHLLSNPNPTSKRADSSTLVQATVLSAFELWFPWWLLEMHLQSCPREIKGIYGCRLPAPYLFAVIGVLVALVAQFFTQLRQRGRFCQGIDSSLSSRFFLLPKGQHRLTISSLVTCLILDTYCDLHLSPPCAFLLRAPIIVSWSHF